MCDEWLEFEKFQDWSLNNGFDKSLSLDRIDNDKGYLELPYYNQGTLIDWVESKVRSDIEKRRILRCVLLGLQHIHNNNINQNINSNLTLWVYKELNYSMFQKESLLQERIFSKWLSERT